MPGQVRTIKISSIHLWLTQLHSYLTHEEDLVKSINVPELSYIKVSIWLIFSQQGLQD